MYGCQRFWNWMSPTQDESRTAHNIVYLTHNLGRKTQENDDVDWRFQMLKGT